MILCKLRYYRQALTPISDISLLNYHHRIISTPPPDQKLMPPLRRPATHRCPFNTCKLESPLIWVCQPLKAPRPCIILDYKQCMNWEAYWRVYSGKLTIINEIGMRNIRATEQLEVTAILSYETRKVVYFKHYRNRPTAIKICINVLDKKHICCSLQQNIIIIIGLLIYFTKEHNIKKTSLIRQNFVIGSAIYCQVKHLHRTVRY